MPPFRTMALLLGATVTLTACDPATAPPPPPVQTDPDLEALETAVAWPGPEVGAVVTLANIYFALETNRRGYDYFSERAADAPEDGVFLAFRGVFAARIAGEVPLLERVAWVEEAIDTLDRAVELDENLPRFLRAVTLARLPGRFGVADEAIDELEFLLNDPRSFIYSDQVPEGTRQPLIRQGWQAVALAAEIAGRPDTAADAWDRANQRPQTPFDPLLGTNYSVDGVDGFRFFRPTFWSPRPWISVAQGFDFSDIAFIQTDDGIVMIDAGTDAENSVSALAQARQLGMSGELHTVFVTHAHWDHIGGLDAILEPGTQVVAQHRWNEELDIVNEGPLDYQWFFGERTARQEPYGPLYEFEPDVEIDDVTDMSIGGVDFTLHPLPGGETDDQLLIELPDEGIVFVGDAYMPFLGAPFVAEGSAEQLLETSDYLLALEPELLIHGHPPLTQNWTIEILEPFRDALSEVERHTRRGIIDGHEVARIVAESPMPELLRDHPAAVVPFVAVRKQFIQRMHRQSTGYWQTNGEGLALATEEEWAYALDLMADGEPEPWIRSIAALIERGDLDLAWRMSERAVKAHPDDPVLEVLRIKALGGLRARYQQYNPFKFIVFSEIADRPTAPLNCDGPSC